MPSKQLVVLKGKKEGIDVVLDAQVGFDEICAELKERIADAKNFFAEAKATIAFKGRELSSKEEEALLEIILSETTMSVSFVECEESPSEAPSNVPIQNVSAAFESHSISSLQCEEFPTVFHKGSIRSGQLIKYDGSVVVVGDTNAGSEIIASGNVVVLGSLKGMVHAGANGDAGCFVSALCFTPTQLRIANIITYIPKTSGRSKDAKKQKTPSYAYVQDGQLYIAPLWD